MKALILSGLIVVLMAGCAVSGSVQKISEGKSGFDGAVYSGQKTEINKPTTDIQYRVFNQGASSFVSVQANLEEAEDRAKRFCEQKQLKYRIISETISIPPHILGNFPRAEVEFECV
jgi:hypothetical protein